MANRLPHTKSSATSLRTLPAISLIAVLLMLAVASCRNKDKPDSINLGDPAELPTMLTRDVSTLISDSGYTRYHISAPVWLVYENSADPRWNFPEGLDMEKYDNNMIVDATIVCDSATYFSQRRLWRLDGNVRMRNTEGDKFLTNQIFWDQSQHKVYSDSFIHIERSNRIIEGFGFTSNEHMTDYVVHRTSGIFPVPERKQPEAAPLPADDHETQSEPSPQQP